MKKVAFTLAEVLITLTIIGVVAALTIPTLIHSYKKHETSTKLKKFYSTMEQAIKLSEADGNPLDEWTFSPQTLQADGSYNYTQKGKDSKAFFDKYLAPYMKNSIVQEGMDIYDASGKRTSVQTMKVQLRDGMIFSLHNGNCMDFNVDINGSALPNVQGKDVFDFLFCTSSYFRGYYCKNDNVYFCPYGWNTAKTREQRLLDCKSDARCCSSLLQLDNWEFKDDYPYKL